jgi:hypothetical protein
MDLRNETPATLRAIAAHCGVTARTVDRWTRNGLESVRLGGRVFTTWEALGRYQMDRNTVRAAVCHHTADLTELARHR